MMKTQISAEASRLLHQATVQQVPGPFVSTDMSMVQVEIDDEVYKRIMEFAEPDDDLSGAIIRAVRLAGLLNLA